MESYDRGERGETLSRSIASDNTHTNLGTAFTTWNNTRGFSLFVEGCWDIVVVAVVVVHIYVTL